MIWWKILFISLYVLQLMLTLKHLSTQSVNTKAAARAIPASTVAHTANTTVRKAWLFEY